MIITLISGFASFIGFLALFLGIAYCIANNSGHSGLSPLIGSMFFVPIIIIGIIGCLKNRSGLSGRLSLTIGLSGFIFGFLIKHTGIMKQYGDWLHSGIEAQNSNSDIILLGYGLLVILVLVVLFVIPNVRSRDESSSRP